MWLVIISKKHVNQKFKFRFTTCIQAHHHYIWFPFVFFLFLFLKLMFNWEWIKFKQIMPKRWLESLVYVVYGFFVSEGNFKEISISIYNVSYYQVDSINIWAWYYQHLWARCYQHLWAQTIPMQLLGAVLGNFNMLRSLKRRSCHLFSGKSVNWCSFHVNIVIIESRELKRYYKKFKAIFIRNAIKIRDFFLFLLRFFL